jgi:hypothetical protein
MKGLETKTISLIHHTDSIKPVKKLTEIYDIIDLKNFVQQNFKDHEDSPIWDIPALKDLNRIRCELMVFHHTDFKPLFVLDKYNKDLLLFFNLLQLRTNTILL